MNRVIVKSDEEYIKHLLAANKSQSDFIRQLQEEIERLREKLHVAEEALNSCIEFEAAGVFIYDIANNALAKIREVK